MRVRARLAALMAVAPVVLSSAVPADAGPSTGSAPEPLSPAQVRAEQWWIAGLDLHRAWSISQGAGVTVAVLDTGVDPHSGDLRGAVVGGFAAGGPGDGRTDIDPDHHGTRIAAEIAGRGTGFGALGVAPRSMILPVTIPGVSLDTDATVVALNRLTAMARPPQVVNMSYSAGGSCPAEVQAAVRQAVRAGMILVAAAGNAGATGNPPTYPASCAGVVAVGAVDRRNRVWPGSARQTYVAVAGPGVHMIGADPAAVSGYGYGTGTSDAAAIVSGSFALLRSHYPSLSSRTLVTRVLHTARQFVGASGSRNADLGYGVVRPYDALSRAVPADAPNPVYAAPDSPAVAASATSSPRRDAATGDPDGALRILAIAAALVALAAAPAVWGTRRRRRAARE